MSEYKSSCLACHARGWAVHILLGSESCYRKVSLPIPAAKVTAPRATYPVSIVATGRTLAEDLAARPAYYRRMGIGE